MAHYRGRRVIPLDLLEAPIASCDSDRRSRRDDPRRLPGSIAFGGGWSLVRSGAVRAQRAWRGLPRRSDAHVAAHGWAATARRDVPTVARDVERPGKRKRAYGNMEND